MKNKKILYIAVAVVAMLLLLWAYNAFLAPKGTVGSKEVTIRIIAEEQSIDKTFAYKTDHEFLTDLLKEKKDELGAEMESSQYGTMIKGMGGYIADASKNEFFLIQVNGEDAATGTDQIAINDGDTYTFILTKW